MNGLFGLFSIFDAKVKAYMRPFAAPSTPFALRSFSDMASEKENQIAHHPEDYFLFRVGTFAEETGGIEPELTSLGCALEYVQQPAGAKQDYEIQ